MEKADLLLIGGTVATMNEQFDLFEPGAVAVRGSDIVAVGPAEQVTSAWEAKEVVDCQNHVVMPGLINTHTHAPMTLVRGLADDLRLDVWLIGYMMPVEREFVQPDFCWLGTQLACAEMARSGIGRGRLRRWGCKIECLIGDERVRKEAEVKGTSRASAAVDLVSERINGGIYVIGNAPTALMRLLDLIEGGMCVPALVVGIPVGFVNASESKERLIAQTKVPYITVKGRKGGSALAASVVNALAEIALSR